MTPDYVADFLKTNDKDRYLASLVVPDSKRAAVQALYAFNADIAAIPSRISEPAPGEIRLQWWHDALSGTQHGAVENNPLAAAFFDVIKQFSLPTGPLLRLVAARRFDLYQDPMPDLETFEGYAGETNAVLYQYAATILGDGTAPQTGDAAGHLGVAHALIGHMQAYSLNLARGRIFLPLDVFAANGLSDADLLTGRPSPALNAAAAQLQETAASHLARAHQEVIKLPKPMRSAFAAMGMLEAELHHLHRANGLLNAHTPVADWRKILALVFWSFRYA